MNFRKGLLALVVGVLVSGAVAQPTWADKNAANKNVAKALVPVITLLLQDGQVGASGGGAATNPLNDTGIDWGGDYPSGNNATCSSNITSPQDCHQGRDATHDDDSDGHAGFSFTKLDASGNPLPASATSWSCVKDNVTGLIWEVKTDDGGIHDKDNTYRWGGVTHLGSGWGTYYSDWDSLVNGSNSAGFCGGNNWRVPTRVELQGLVDYSRIAPAIDVNYFPNELPYSVVWSASPHFYSYDAWSVSFTDGDTRSRNRSSSKQQVRLVRSGQ